MGSAWAPRMRMMRMMAAAAAVLLLVRGTGGERSSSPPGAARSFLLQEKHECHFVNGTRRVRFLERHIYGRQKLVRFDSDRGEFEAAATLGEFIARDFNSQKDYLEFKRNQVERCRHNYGVAQAGMVVGRRVPPTSVTISPTRDAPGGPHTVLLCTASGFYPAEVEIRWLRNGQEVGEGVAYEEEVPNGDWTYQATVLLETLARRGDVFACQVGHAGLEAPITVQWEPRGSDSARSKVWTGAVGALLGGLFLAVGLCLHLKKRKKMEEATPTQLPPGLLS